jgi:hypothetical protein
MSEHPLQPLIPNEEAAAALASTARCSVSHLRNIAAGRKNASLPLAKRLSDATGLAMDSFMQPEAAE